MTRRLAGALGLVGAILATACGKKGNPLPPVRPVPARVAEFSAHRVDDRIELQLIVPNANADASSPLVITRVEIFRAPVLQGAAPLSAPQIMGRSRNILAEIDIRRPDSAPTAGGALPPTPGERTTFTDRIEGNRPPSVVAWSYLAVGTAGRGRRGSASAAITVPIGPLPAAPEALTFSQTETTLTLTWKPSAATGQAFNVFGVTNATDQSAGELLTPKPLTAATFSLPMQFGRERCLAVQAIIATPGVLVDGARSGVTCVTPADTFPPLAPTNLVATAEVGAVTLTWSAVSSADLAGYIVLRSDATGIDMRPLQRDPIREITFRDTTAQAGQTYTYTVYAADSAPTPNISQQSNRQVVIAR